MEVHSMLNSRKRMGKVMVFFCIAAMTAFASIAQAHEGEGGCGGRGHHPGFIFKKLGLTDAQKAQAKAIFKANRAVVKPIFASMKTERKNLHALIHADTVDEAAIRAETAKIAGIQADLNVSRAKIGVQFRAILTPEQLATLKALKQKWQAKHNASPEQGE